MDHKLGLFRKFYGHNYAIARSELRTILRVDRVQQFVDVSREIRDMRLF